MYTDLVGSSNVKLSLINGLSISNCPLIVNLDIPGVPPKNFPYLSCYSSKSVFNLIKILKEISLTMLNLDLSICFISVSACIDFLWLFPEKQNTWNAQERAKNSSWIESLNLHLKIRGNSVFQLNSNSTELELHKGTQERLYLSLLSVKSTIMLDVRRQSIVHKARSFGPHLSVLPALMNTNVRNWLPVVCLHTSDAKHRRNGTCLHRWISHLFKGFSSVRFLEKLILRKSLDEQKITKNNMDPSEPVSKRLPFTSLKTRQWLLFWNCSNWESFLWDTR